MKNDNNPIQFIYWFSNYHLDSPSVRYRAYYPLQYFKKYKGVNSYLVIPGYSFSKIIQFFKAYFSALLFRKSGSLIVIQKVQSNFIYARLLKFLIRIRKTNTIYDLDDADYMEKNPKTIYYFARHCAKISGGSQQIISHLTKMNNRAVHTTSPVVNLNIVKQKRNEVFTIGWIGGFAGEHKITITELVFPAIKKLDFPLKLTLIGVIKPEDKEFVISYFKNHTQIEIEIPIISDWNNEEAIQHQIALFDVGIATLTNSELQVSKSGIKAKQYLNNGVPVLSSPLPENNQFITEGINGYFCSTENDFSEKLNLFYQMSFSEYDRFIENSRKSIVHFDHDHYFNDFIKLARL